MLATAAVMLGIFASASAQFFSSYQSSNQYQTTTNFTQQYMDLIRNNTEGYVVRMSNGAKEDCQKFNFIDGNDFRFTVRDANNVSRVLEDRYIIKYATLFRPAMIELQMIPGLLGADMMGQLHLYPLVATKNVLAVANQGGTKMVLTPNKNVTHEEILRVLKEHSFPVQDLFNVTATCRTNTNSTAPAPTTFQRILGFFSGFRHSPQGTPSFFLPVGISEAAVRTEQVVNPETIAQQTLSAIQHNSVDSVVPAPKNLSPLFYASNGVSRPQAYVPGGYMPPSFRSFVPIGGF